MVMQRRQANLRLQEARARKGWSQEELAAQLGTTFETVSRWERGVMLPSPYFRTRLCAVFGLTAEALGLLFEAEMALHSSLSSTQVVVAWAALDKEHEVVRHVLAALRAQGILTASPWLLGQHGPAQKQERLDEAIRAAQLVLLILSPHAPASRDVKTTAHLAQLYGRPLAALWIAGDQQQECLPPNAPSLLNLIDARTGDKETIVQGVLDLVEQTTPAEPAKMEATPLLAQTSSEESFRQTSLEVLDRRLEEDTLQVEPRPLSMLQRRNRQRLLDKVQTFWITGVLERSLHDMALIALRLSALPEAVEQPWRLVFAQPDRTPLLFEAGTTISQVYDQACGELLILGEPGAGKTTLLLELARDLITRARSDETLPLPVVFNLSSWSQKKLPLAEWLVEELHLKYQVPRQLGTAWVQTDSLLPLLDGVDEVATEHREACIKAINAFRWEHGLLPMVVCSRSSDYFMQPQRIILHSAVTVQPLTPGQIEAHVEQAGEPLSALRVVLHEDAELRELASTPLMLSILMLTYHDMPVENLLREGIAPARQRVFEHYVERMLTRRGSATSYPPQQTKHWLAWLAQQLARQSQAEFYIEWMQPAWLEKSRSHQFYHHMVVRLLNSLVGGLVGILVFELFTDPQSALIAGLVGLLAGFLIQGKTTGTQSTERATWSWGRTWHRFIPTRALHNGLIGALLFGCLIEPLRFLLLFGGPFTWPDLVGLFTEQFSPLQVLMLDVPLGGLVGGLVGVLTRRPTDIEPVEVIAWSWTSMWRSFVKVDTLRNGLLCGLFYGVLCGLIVQSFGQTNWLVDGLDQGINTGLVVAMLLGTSRGLSSTTLERHSRLRPNEGMWHSAQNSALVGVVGGVIFGVIYSLSSGLTDWVVLGQAHASLDPLGVDWSYLLSALVFGLAGGLLSGFLSGGGAWIKHNILRLLLWCRGCIPWSYPRFLDYAAEHILLRKVGGGYIFIHRLLLDYFASLETLSSEETSAVSASLQKANEKG